MKVRDLMSEALITLNAASPLISAEEVMGLSRVRHLPCVEGGRFVGLITHRDLMRAYLPVGSPVERAIFATKSKVRDFMHTDVKTVSPNAELTEAAQILRTHRYGCLPVVDDAGDLIGIVTDADFLLLAERVVAMLEREDPQRLERLKAEVDGLKE